MHVFASHGFRGLIGDKSGGIDAGASPEEAIPVWLKSLVVVDESKVTVDHSHSGVAVLKSVRPDVLIEQELPLRGEGFVNPCVDTFQVRNVVKDVVGEDGVKGALGELLRLQVGDEVADLV